MSARSLVVSDPVELDDRAIVLDAIETMLKLDVVSAEMSRQLLELRRRVEAIRPPGDQADGGSPPHA